MEEATAPMVPPTPLSTLSPTCSMPQSISFLTLPAELRNMVYAHIIPVNRRADEYIGMYLSCKQVHNEVLSAARKEMVEILQTVETKWMEEEERKEPLLISRPKSYKDLQNLKIDLPCICTDPCLNWHPSACICCDDPWPTVPECLFPVLAMPLKTLEFKLQKDGCTTDTAPKRHRWSWYDSNARKFRLAFFIAMIAPDLEVQDPPRQYDQLIVDFGKEPLVDYEEEALTETIDEKLSSFHPRFLDKPHRGPLLLCLTLSKAIREKERMLYKGGPVMEKWLLPGRRRRAY